MALTSDRLETNLLRFCDANEPNFDGFPTTREQARDKWAAAFDDYISVIQEKIAWPAPIADTHPTLVLAQVKKAFFDTLVLAPGTVAQAAALDFADAWQAGVAAITAGPGAVDSAGDKYSLFTAFTNVSTLHGNLAATLETLFAAPSRDVKARIGDIASAFHTATSGLQASMTQTKPNGATVVVTIGVQ